MTHHYNGLHGVLDTLCAVCSQVTLVEILVKLV